MFATGCVQHGLDEWFVQDVLPRMQGHGCLRRCAEDGIIGCEREAAARRLLDVLPQRFPRFRLTLHPEKTARMAFQRPPRRDRSAGGTGTLALLGFTPSWAQTRQGYWGITRKTGGKRLRRCMQESWTWGRETRHAPLHEQHRT